jgi:hypothetical protein
MDTIEYIAHEATRPAAWVCLCGNTPSGGGFYPCDSAGNAVAPTPDRWTTGCYVCTQCGRIIDQHSLEVVGRKIGIEVVR